MKYVISYACVSDRGRARRINQDNFICRGVYMEPPDGGVAFPLTGKTEPSGRAAASLIAAKNASKLTLGADAAADMIDFCKRTNDDICRFADEHGVASTGTTAAMLAFTDKCVTVCNIGDSRVYRLAGGELAQISTDHVINAAPGRKPPLSQNLGIPKTEMKIEPYAARGAYGDGDVYVICSDGLTDGVARGYREGRVDDVRGGRGGSAREACARRRRPRQYNRYNLQNRTRPRLPVRAGRPRIK